MRRHVYRIAVAVLIASTPSLAQAVQENETSLLTSTELEGGALTPESTPTVQPRSLNTAMLAALQAQAQIRRVELSLKSGPAQNGDLRVVEAGNPDPNQK